MGKGVPFLGAPGNSLETLNVFCSFKLRVPT